ncbi:DUF2304 family protein [Candidatus Woesearchaeota archaeon]|nr:MAG: DUF2304 family protein [Candidatus Woesearchaeota archaeon]
MQPIQIIALVIMVFGVLRTLMSYRERRISAQWLVFWLLIWGGVGVVAFLPGLAAMVSEPLGIGRAIDLVVYASILLLFYLIFRIYLRLESLEHNVTKLVREIAIRRK